MNQTMGMIFPKKIRRSCFSYEESSARILIVGLDSAGKSTLIARFKNLVDLQLNTKASYVEHIITEPTFVYQVDTIYPRHAPIALNLWDLGGQKKTRELWRFYLVDVEGIEIYLTTFQNRFSMVFYY
jgi:small GTP-binding protein